MDNIEYTQRYSQLMEEFEEAKEIKEANDAIENILLFLAHNIKGLES